MSFCGVSRNKPPLSGPEDSFTPLAEGRPWGGRDGIALLGGDSANLVLFRPCPAFYCVLHAAEAKTRAAR